MTAIVPIADYDLISASKSPFQDFPVMTAAIITAAITAAINGLTTWERTEDWISVAIAVLTSLTITPAGAAVAHSVVTPVQNANRKLKVAQVARYAAERQATDAEAKAKADADLAFEWGQAAVIEKYENGQALDARVRATVEEHAENLNPATTAVHVVAFTTNEQAAEERGAQFILDQFEAKRLADEAEWEDSLDILSEDFG